MAPFIEKIWTVLGREFGEYSGRKSIVVSALYGLMSAGYAFRNLLVDWTHHLGLFPFPADLYLWMKNKVIPDDGFNYYTYVIIYVDNVMVMNHDTETVLSRIDKYFKLKTSSIGDNEIYLGGK